MLLMGPQGGHGGPPLQMLYKLGLIYIRDIQASGTKRLARFDYFRQEQCLRSNVGATLLH
jgi:hypothetical protein